MPKPIQVGITFILFVLTFAASAQELSVRQKGEIFATILQGKLSRNFKWTRPGGSGEKGNLTIELLYPRSIVRDSQEIAYHLDMCQRLFLSFFSSTDLRGLHSYEVFFPVIPGHSVDSYELFFDANFHDMQESEFMRLERLTRAVPYFAWSNYLAITSRERDRVVVNLKDTEHMTPDSCRDDYCNVIAFSVYYYVFRQHCTKPLEIIYRSSTEVKRYEFPVKYDFKQLLALFDTKFL
jgi:hypothetical protein